MSNIRASVIIPTYNGKEKIIRLLHEIEQFSLDDIEVVVIIDGSTDGTFSAIESTLFNLQNLLVIEQINKGRAAARNAGAARAQSEILIFLDDDMLPENSCITQHIEFHLSNPSLAVALGKITEPAEKNDTEVMQYKHFLNTVWEKDIKPYENNYLPDQMTILSAANFSLSKQLFLSYHGFDEHLKDIEDYDFALRIKKDSVKVFYLSDAVATHKDDFTFTKFGRRAKAYITNMNLAASLKSDLYNSSSTLSYKPTAFQSFMYRFFQHEIWLRMLDKANFFSLLFPKSLRYKLYNVIITAYSRHS